MVLKLGSTILIVAVRVLLLLGYRTYARKRDLAETLEWMSQTYNPRQDGWVATAGLTVSALWTAKPYR